MSRAATTRTVGDQITTLLTGFHAHDGRARDWCRGSSRRSSSRRCRCCWRSWSSKRRSDTSAASRACAGPRSCRPAKRSRRSMKAACRRRWCVASTSSPTATSSTTRPMCLAFGLPGVGKSHAMCAVGHALVDRGHAVLFMPTYSLVQELLGGEAGSRAAARLAQTRSLRGAASSTTSGYIQQSPEEAEILFTLLAERYERRSVFITSNLIFAQWDRIFRDQMATAAAIDRLVHHSVLLEFDVPSFRTEHAKRRGKAAAEPSGGRFVTKHDRAGCPRIDDRRVGRPEGRPVCAASRAVQRDRQPARGRGRCRPRGRADAPTAPWKTADRFPQRPPPSSSS